MSSDNNKQGNSVSIGGSGNVIGGIGQGDQSRVEATVYVTQGESSGSSSIHLLIASLQEKVNALQDSVDRQMAQVAVNGLQEELEKGEAADETTLQKRLDTLKTTLRDAFEVAITTIANPSAGFALVAQKVAARAREQGG